MVERLLLHEAHAYLGCVKQSGIINELLLRHIVFDHELLFLESQQGLLLGEGIQLGHPTHHLTDVVAIVDVLDLNVGGARLELVLDECL